MPSETVSEGIAFVPLFYITGNAVRSTVRPAFPIRKKTAFPPSTRYDSHKPLQYPSRLLFRASLRKPKNPVDSSPRFSSPKKKRFSCSQPSRWQTRCNTRPDFSSVPLPASRKIRLTVRPAFPLRKKRLSCNQPARQQTRCNTRPDFSTPSQSMAYLVSFKFLRPVFSKRRQRFFPFFNQTFFR